MVEEIPKGSLSHLESYTGGKSGGVAAEQDKRWTWGQKFSQGG
jgi:hypothetical protein